MRTLLPILTATVLAATVAIPQAAAQTHPLPGVVASSSAGSQPAYQRVDEVVDAGPHSYDPQAIDAPAGSWVISPYDGPIRCLTNPRTTYPCYQQVPGGQWQELYMVPAPAGSPVQTVYPVWADPQSLTNGNAVHYFTSPHWPAVTAGQGSADLSSTIISSS